MASSDCNLENLIKELASYYVNTKNATYEILHEKFGISKSVIYRYFKNDLQRISPELYEKVIAKSNKNSEKTKNNFKKKYVQKKITDNIFTKIKNIFNKD